MCGFTRIAWEELHDLGIEDRCRIESPPVKALNSDYLRLMLEAGLADCCHVIGTHGYNDQIDDERIRYPWERCGRGHRRPAGRHLRERRHRGLGARRLSRAAPAWRADLSPPVPCAGQGVRLRLRAAVRSRPLAQREQEWRIAIFAPMAPVPPLQPIWDAVRESWGDVRRSPMAASRHPRTAPATGSSVGPPGRPFPVELRAGFPARPGSPAAPAPAIAGWILAGHRQDLVVRQVADLLAPGRAYASGEGALTGGRDAQGAGLRSVRGRPSGPRARRRPAAWTTLTLDVSRQPVAGGRAAQQGHRQG